MRALVACALALVDCIDVPPVYVAAGSTPWQTQMKADQACIDLLATGVEVPGERPTVIDRHGFHRDKRPMIRLERGPSVTCVFSWFDPRKGHRTLDNVCVCDVATVPGTKGGDTSNLFVPGEIMDQHERIEFNACYELHRRGAFAPPLPPTQDI